MVVAVCYLDFWNGVFLTVFQPSDLTDFTPAWTVTREALFPAPPHVRVFLCACIHVHRIIYRHGFPEMHSQVFPVFVYSEFHPILKRLLDK